MRKPSLFRELDLAAAHRAAEEEGKAVLLEVAGAFCPTCVQMDRTTWRSPEVERWVARHAVAIQLDSSDSSVAPLGVMASSTLILFRGGQELDRSIGAKSPDDLLDWLNAALSGKTELQRLQEEAQTDLDARLHYAQALVAIGRNEEALGELVWLW